MTTPLFSDQFSCVPAPGQPSAYLETQSLGTWFKARPDAMLSELGGTRVEVAIGVERTMYQLEVGYSPDAPAQFVANWVKTETSMRRARAATAVQKKLESVPLTLGAAIESLCETFGLAKESVLRAGVNLLAFWEGSQAGERLELPMSADWARYRLAGQ